LELQEVTGATFANVHFDGVAPSRTALLGGHVDAALHGLSPLLPNAQSGELRILAVFDDQESEFAPGVKTAAAQGYEVYDVITRAWIAPAGTPKEIVEILSDAIKKAMDTEEHKKKMQEACQSPRYMNPTELGEYWDKLDVQMKPLLDMALQK
jgi:tripartite-type tricarboxylate transporter receptor subunit TctC